MSRRPLLLSLLVPALLAGPAQAAKPFDVRDLVTLDRVSAPVLSPDGRKLVVAVREVDFAANKAATGLWIEDLYARDAAPPVRFTAEGFNVNSAAFSPDGASVYFLSAKSGSQQLWRQAVAGGEAMQVTDYPLDVGSYKLSPDGRSVASGSLLRSRRSGSSSRPASTRRWAGRVSGSCSRPTSGGAVPLSGGIRWRRGSSSNASAHSASCS